MKKITYRLANNENPLGPSTKAIQAAGAALESLHYYPDSRQYHLKQVIADDLSLNPAQLTLGNGSENILELIVKSYLLNDAAAVISQYAFITIAQIVKSYGAKLIEVPVKDWIPDIESMINAIDAKTRVLFLVNPNNPTGAYTNANDFLTLLNAIPQQVLVVVDEAYVEYVTAEDYPDTLSYLADYPNLIILRTFSKAYGLAGLRLGYAISSTAIANQLDLARLPYHVNAVAEKAGCVALHDKDHIKKTFLANQMGMQQMEAGLKNLNLSYIPSVANFITIDVGDASLIYEKLLQHHIIVRPLHDYGMPNHIRVSIGREEDIAYFLQVMEQLI